MRRGASAHPCQGWSARPHGVSDFTAQGDCGRYRLPVAGTPLRPHVATPAELRERLRAEAAGGAVPRPARRGRPAAHRRARGRPRAAHDRPRRGDRRGAAWDARRVAHPRDARAARERLDDRRRRPLAQRHVGQRGARRPPAGACATATSSASAARRSPSARRGRAARRRDADRRGRAGGRRPDAGAAPRARRALPALPRRAFATPASNPAIARELSVSVDAVKSTMRALFELFGIGDLPQNQKRAGLALQALRGGVVVAPRPLGGRSRVRRVVADARDPRRLGADVDARPG